MENKKVIVGLECDGWCVIFPEGKRYRWNHNDEDMGTEGIIEMLKDLGFKVEFEEWY